MRDLLYAAEFRNDALHMIASTRGDWGLHIQVIEILATTLYDESVLFENGYRR